MCCVDCDAMCLVFLLRFVVFDAFCLCCFGSVLCRVVLLLLCYAVLCFVLLFCYVLCCITLCYVVLLCSVLCYLHSISFEDMSTCCESRAHVVPM